MLEKLDVKQMRLLILLLEKRSISRTAEVLDVSQQAVSFQLKTLRTIFQDQLFVRHGHGVVPTPKALRLCEALEGVLQELESAAAPDIFDPKSVAETFVISATDYTQHVILAELFRYLKVEAPGLKLLIKDLEIDTLEASLTDGSVDLAVTIPEFLPDNIPYTTIFSETYKLVMSADREQVLIKDLKQLNDYEYVIVSPARPNLRGSSTDWFKDHQVERNIVASIPSFSVLCEYIHGSDVLAFIPARMLPDDRVKEIPLNDYPPGFETVIAWHPKTAHDPLYRWIIEQIQHLAG